MVAFGSQAQADNIPIYGSDEVADVTGAGDRNRNVYCRTCGGRRPESAAQLAELCGWHRGYEARERYRLPAGAAAALENPAPIARSQ